MSSAMPEPLLPTLLERWVGGWCLSRGIAPKRTSYGWVAQVATETRRVEHFVVSPTTAELAHLAHLAGGRPDAWVTVLGDIPLSQPAGLVAITHAERMMVADLAPQLFPSGIRMESANGVAKAVAMVDSVIAARGQVAVHGVDAVFDRVRTEPAFQRRGLARQIMAGLEHWAVEHGASSGLLLASVEGRPRYASLGWREVAPLMTFCGDPLQPV